MLVGPFVGRSVGRSVGRRKEPPPPPPGGGGGGIPIKQKGGGWGGRSFTDRHSYPPLGGLGNTNLRCHIPITPPSPLVQERGTFAPCEERAILWRCKDFFYFLPVRGKVAFAWVRWKWCLMSNGEG